MTCADYIQSLSFVDRVHPLDDIVLPDIVKIKINVGIRITYIYVQKKYS